MTHVVGVVNEKGGVGKTATTVNLAGTMVRTGLRCLVVDFDPQGSATEHLGLASSGAELAGALLGECSLGIFETDSGIDVVPSGPELQRLVEANRRARERLLEKALSCENLEPYDVVLIDGPARNDQLSDNVLVASDAVLIPAQCKNQSITPVVRLLDTIEQVQAEFGAPRSVAGILLTMHDSRTRMSQGFEAAMRNKYGDRVLDTVVRENTRVAEAAGKASSIDRYSPDSSGAADYSHAADELLARIGLLKSQRVANG